MITYGHEKFIEQAINGILMQECDFEVELIIANDCSPDQTGQIIQNILENHPRGCWVKYMRHDKNLGMMPNFIFAMQECQGKYIALCEGDDYWTDPLKLKKQVDFLEANNDINICFHRSNLLENGNLRLHEIPKDFEEKSFSYIELLRHYNFIATASVMFRKFEPFHFPDWLGKLPFGDMGLYKLVSGNKKIYCLSENMSVYRIHDKGVWSGLSNLSAEKIYLTFYKTIYLALNYDERQVVKLKTRGFVAKIAKLKFSNNRVLEKIYSIYLRLNS